MKKFISQESIEEKIHHHNETIQREGLGAEEPGKALPKSGLSKNIIATVLSLALLMIGTLAWFDYGKAPNVIDIKIENPTAEVVVREVIPASTINPASTAAPASTSGPAATPGYGPVLTPTGVPVPTPTGPPYNIVSVSFPEGITFFKWKGVLLSSFEEELYYKITVTSRFNILNFSNNPALYIDASLKSVASDAWLQNLKVVRAQYKVMAAEDSADCESTFWENGFEELYPTPVPTATLGPGETPAPVPMPTYPPETISEISVESLNVGTITKDLEEYFQSTVYLKVYPDVKAVEEIMNKLNASIFTHDVKNELTLSFGFLSVPYYTPGPTFTPRPKVTPAPSP